MMVKGYGFLFKLEADGGPGKGEIVMEEVNRMMIKMRKAREKR
jgi:hypothetical protein